MIDAWISLLVMAVMAGAGWGTGARLIRGLKLETDARIGFPIVVGMALWCFLGGLLNLFSLAVPIAHGCLLLAGLLAAGIEVARILRADRDQAHSDEDRRTGMLLVAGYFALFLLLTVFQMPAAVVNIGDDFGTYLVRAERMTATGSVTNDLFDGIGQDGLGAHTFLQAFVLLALPLPFVGGLEHVFCLMLCLLLVREFGVILRLNRIWTMAASVLLLLIHPQAVNLSSVYSTTAVALGLALALTLDRAGRHGGVLLSGLLLGALVTLKTIGGFQATFFGVLLAAARFRPTNVAGWLREHLAIAGISVAVVVPWMIAVADRFRMIFNPVDPAAVYHPPADARQASSFFDFIGTEGLLYGGSLLTTDLLVVLLLVFAVIWLIGFRREGSRTLLPVAVTCLATLATFVLNNALFNAHTAIRYSIPLMLAAAPLAVFGAGTWMSQQRKAPAMTTIAVAAMVGILFLQPAAGRVKQTIEWQTFIPYPIDAAYAENCSLSFSDGARNYLRAFQQHVPENQSLLTWIRTPFLLDQSRNQIHAGCTPGMMAPWLRPPLTGEAEDMHRFLRDRGVDYVLFERQDSTPANEVLMRSGNAIYQKVAVYDYAIERGLENLAKESRLVAAHERFILFEVSKKR